MDKVLRIMRGVVAVLTGGLILVAAGGKIETLAAGSGGGAINAISFSEFEKDTEYINKLVPGNENPAASDYYAKPSFYNSAAGAAKFELASGGTAEVYEGEVGFNCDILGVNNYLVDFTGVDLTNIARTNSTSVGATYANGKAGVKDLDALDVRTKAQKAAMLQNTLFLQSVEYCAAGSNTTITIPKGVYYFAVGHHYNRTRNADGTYSGGAYVILPVNNVNIRGAESELIMRRLAKL